MTVDELVEKLAYVNPDAIVEVWDPYHDKATTTVFVSKMRNGRVLISNTDFNK